MITFIVRQEHEPPVEVKVEGDTACIGRAPGCEVVLRPNYVSKRHLRVLKGIVLVDLGSANGTFVDGARLQEAVLYTGGEVRIGNGDVTLTIVGDEAAPGAEEFTQHAMPEPAPSAEEASGKPPSVAATMRDDGISAVGPGDSGGAAADAAATADLERQVADLERRLRDLDEEHAQAQARLSEFEQGLEHEREQTRAEASARQQAEQALDEARREAESLRAELAAPREVKPAAPSSPAGELLIKLTAENAALKRKLAESASKGGGASAPAAPAQPVEGTPAKLLAEILELRAQNATLRAQAAEVRHDARHEARTETRAEPRPVPAKAPIAPPAAPAGGEVRALFLRLAREDVDGFPQSTSGEVEEFLVIEQFRLVRHLERIVTRMAGDFNQLLEGRTMLPGQSMVNLRQLMERMCDGSEDEDARREWIEYSTHLSRWLVASLGAHRKAASSFAASLKRDLSESALVEKAPIPTFKKLAGQAEGELWRRVSAYLKELSPDMVEDRIETLAREAALALIKENGGTEA